MYSKFFSVIFCLSLSWGVAQAQSQIFLDADKMDFKVKPSIVELLGGVEIKSQGLEVFCEYARYNQKKERAYLDGNLRLVHEALEAHASQGELVLSEQLVKLNRSVRLKMRGGRNEELFCDNLTYHWARDLILASGHIELNFEGRKLTAQRARWERKKGLLTIDGRVKILQEDGSWLNSEKVVWDLHQDKILATGGVTVKANLPRAINEPQGEGELEPVSPPELRLPDWRPSAVDEYKILPLPGLEY